MHEPAACLQRQKAALSFIYTLGLQSLLFSSPIFWLLTAVVVALTFVNQRVWQSVKVQNLIFLAASILFYAGWDWRFLGLVCFSVFLDFFAAKAIHQSRSFSAKRAFLAVSLTGNLGLLFFFKYFNFFVGEAIALMNLIGFQANPFTLQIILPIGISFYTLQTMSYTIDVYRGVSKPEKNFLTYATYVVFFPQLLAGPIERANTMLPQFARFNKITWLGVYRGLCLITVGLFLKIVIADNLAPTVDAIFNTYEAQNGGVRLLGGLYFVVQLYGDFCGYSTIALGLGALFGVRLSTNFETPLFATSITAFWQRWHITLYSFLRDYLYRPLGGRDRRALNVLLLFTISGVWHGANWTFILWGAINGLALVLWSAVTSGREPANSKLTALLGWGITQAIILIGFIVFRSPDLAASLSYISGMFLDPSLPDGYRIGMKYVLLAAVLDLLWRKDVRLSQGLVPQLGHSRWRTAAEALLIALMLNTILVSGIAHVDQTAFIYFQF